MNSPMNIGNVIGGVRTAFDALQEIEGADRSGPNITSQPLPPMNQAGMAQPGEPIQYPPAQGPMEQGGMQAGNTPAAGQQLIGPQQQPQQDMGNQGASGLEYGLNDPMAPMQTPGTVSVPSPQENPGFWETIRTAAKNDPYTFYTILSKVAMLDPGGIQQVMAQKQQMEMQQSQMGFQREKYETDTGFKQQDIDLKARSVGVDEEALGVRREEIDSKEQLALKKETLRLDEKKRKEETDWVKNVQQFADSNPEQASKAYGDLGISSATGIQNREQGQNVREHIMGQLKSDSDTTAAREREERGVKLLEKVAKNYNLPPSKELRGLMDESPYYKEAYSLIVSRGKEKESSDKEMEELRKSVLSNRLKQIETALSTSRGQLSDSEKTIIRNAEKRTARIFSEWKALHAEVSEKEIYAEFLSEDVQAQLAEKKQHMEKLKQDILREDEVVEKYLKGTPGYRPYSDLFKDAGEDVEVEDAVETPVETQERTGATVFDLDNIRTGG